MNSSGKRIPAGWSFVGGTLLGALATVALPASIHMGGARGTKGQGPVAAVSEVRAVTEPSIADDRDAGMQPEDHRLAGHSELELQPD